MALAEQEGSDRMFGEIVVALGLLSSSAVADALGEQMGWTSRLNLQFAEGLDGRDEEAHASSALPATPRPLPVSPIAPLALPEALRGSPGDNEDVAASQTALVATEAEPAGRFDKDRHLLFVPTSAGYRIVERQGAAPERGATVKLTGDHESRRYLVVKRSGAPIPASRQLCAYLLPL